MEGSPELNAESSKYPDALILPNNFIDFLSGLVDETGQFILPVDAFEKLFNFEFWENFHEDFQ